MSGNKCFLCGQRKPNRSCPGHNASICSKCCGKQRGSGFACPTSCRHLATAQAYEQTRESDHWTSTLRVEAKRLIGREDYLEPELYFIEAGIIRAWRANPSLPDKEVYEALKSLIISQEGGGDQPPEISIRARLVVTEVEKGLDEVMGGTRRPSKRVLPALKRVALSVLDHRDERLPQAYLSFAAEHLPPKPVLRLPSFQESDSEDFDNDLDDDTPNSTNLSRQEQAELLAEANMTAKDIGKLRKVSLHIVFEPFEDPNYPDELDEIPDLLQRIAREPDLMQGILEPLLQKYPDHQHILHYLTQIARAKDDTKAFETLARRNLELHPDYLFARLDVAKFLIDEGRFDEVKAVFDKGFEVSAYLGRTTVHATEFTSFNAILFLYLQGTGKLAMARQIVNMIRQVDPEHPCVKIADESNLPFFAKLKTAFHRLIGRDPLASTEPTDDQ